MQIESIPIAQIKPAAYNPRKELLPGSPEYDLLAKGLDTFGLVEPLVWNRRTGNLVGGHQRLSILIAQGAAEVECSVVDLPLDLEKALNVALNKLGGEWDMPRLKDVLADIDCGQLDTELTGFTLDDMADIMSQFHIDQSREVAEQIATETERNHAQAIAEEAVTRIGELFADIAQNAPARLAKAQAVILPKTAKHPTLLLDDSAADLITELERYAEAGADSPLSALLSARFPLATSTSDTQ